MCALLNENHTVRVLTELKIRMNASWVLFRFSHDLTNSTCYLCFITSLVLNQRVMDLPTCFFDKDARLNVVATTVKSCSVG